MNVNKQILQNDLMKTHNKIVTLSDIHNLIIPKSPASDALKVLVTSFERTDSTLNILKNEKISSKQYFIRTKKYKAYFLCVLRYCL